MIFMRRRVRDAATMNRHVKPTHHQRPIKMTLRARLHLLVTGLTVAFVVVLVGAETITTRARIREDLEGANQVAVQLIGSLVNIYWSAGGDRTALAFLQRLGHVRSSDIILRYPNGRILYRSPAATYKAGRYAPDWFSHLLAPHVPLYVFRLPSGLQLLIEAEPSRAILDGWNAVTRLLAIAAVMLLVMNGIAFWIIERALAPLPVIVDGLERLQQGELGFRLPALAGVEAHAIGAAFNRMAQAVQDNVTAERKAREAETRLEERREMSRLVEQRLEEERRLIAHELHDELGQSVTAIRTLAQAIVVRSGEPSMQRTARLISEEAGRLYDAMRGLIPRLAPLSLDALGLAAAIENLVRDLRKRHPAIKFAVRHELTADLGPSVTLSVYRFVQEGLINALRHAHASRMEVELRADPLNLRVSVTDDGRGLPEDWDRPGHFGLRGLRERIGHLGGRFEVRNGEHGGVRLVAEIPLAELPQVNA